MKTGRLAEKTSEIAFFQKIAANLAFITKKDHILISKAVDGVVTDFIDSVVFWSNNHFADNVRYSLKGTPCKAILEGSPRCYVKQVQLQFPGDKDLKDLNAESYFGCPIFSSSGGILGHIAIIDSRPLENELELMTIAHAFASLAASEFERVRIIEKLKQSEARYRVIYDSTPAIFFTVNHDNEISSINAYGLSKLGYRPNELIGKSVLHTVMPEDIEVYRSDIKECFADNKEVRNWEIRKVHKNGLIIWCRESARVIDDENGMQSLLVVSEDITEAYELSQQLAFQATHDSLTGLVNRRQFEIIFENVLREGYSDLRKHVLCYLDLDGFKAVNDTCGHLGGDELLRHISGLMQSKIRDNDILARLGGDEFAVLMQNCSLDQALRIAHELRALVEEYQFVWKGKCLMIGISIGLVPIDDKICDFEQILNNADAACYAAKNAGRNTVHVFKKCLSDTDLAITIERNAHDGKPSAIVRHNR